ncbi:hypothetical protein [Streptomyces sp. MJP52]|uniref:hypothetical protein n=1 Tax=Streptomyces sp. MJP52 TaxID=2940555 RepID=UPI0024735C28|nr:hypothetical protein [Streptomyces sp. MJP52]MDH6228403.1 hypothetical protein [Streptomyces sp. MJP52]
MITGYAAARGDLELADLFLTLGHRFGRVESRRRTRDHVRGPPAPWPARTAGSRPNRPPTHDGLQAYVADKPGETDGLLISDDTGFTEKGTTSAGFPQGAHAQMPAGMPAVNNHFSRSAVVRAA